MEILADEYGADAQLFNEDFTDEIFGRELRELLSESLDDCRLKSSDTKPFKTLLRRGETFGGKFGTQDFQRGGFEGQCGRRLSSRCGAMGHIAQGFLVAEVNSVKVANGQHAATAERCIVRVPGGGRRKYGKGSQLCGRGFC